MDAPDVGGGCIEDATLPAIAGGVIEPPVGDEVAEVGPEECGGCGAVSDGGGG